MTNKCPHCGAEMPDQLEGEARCPVCGETQAAAAAPDQEAPPAPPAQDTPPLQETSAPPEPPIEQTEQAKQAGFSLPPSGEATAQSQQYQAPASEAQPWPSAPVEDLSSFSPAWEGDDPLIKGLWRTIWQVLLHPVKSFRAPALPGHAWAVSFGLILGTFGAAMQVLWSRVFDQPGMIPLPAFWWLILSPLMVLVTIYVNAGIIHLGLIMVGGAKNRFRSTLRVMGYSQAPALFYVVPFVGMAVGGIWGLVVIIGGLAGAHGISGWRVVWACVLLFIIFAAIITIIVLIVGTGMVLGILGHMAGKGSML
jgi:uncharacterized Zn finger protein (UPF0148 family)